MNIPAPVIAYLGAMVTFFIVDYIWLSYIAKDFLKIQLAPLLRDDFNLVAAGIFYVLYGVGIVVFAVMPAMQNGGWKQALGLGALFGFFCYAAYDLTNLATLKGWPLKMALVDMAWGTFLTGICALSAFLITQKFMA